MKNKLKKILTILEIIIQVLVLPICKNKVFFLNIIVLIVLPSMINAYWVNRDVYVTISSIYKYGIIIRYGASVPYIFFIPFVLAYIVSLIGWWTKKLNIKIALLYKLLVYIILMFLFVVNIFCLMNFKTMLSPAIVMLMAETNRGETLEFFKSYLFNFDSLQSYLIIAILLIWLLYSEKRQVVDIQGKRTIVLLLSLTLYMFQRSVSPFQTFIKMFACKNLTEVELWYLK